MMMIKVRMMAMMVNVTAAADEVEDDDKWREGIVMLLHENEIDLCNVYMF